jgi:hypothetical protein
MSWGETFSRAPPLTVSARPDGARGCVLNLKLNCSIGFEVMLPSVCSFIVDVSFRNIEVKHHTHLKMAM